MNLGPALAGVPADITVLAFSHDGRWLAAGGRDGEITLWDLSAAEQDGVISVQTLADHPPPFRSWQAHDGQVSELAFAPGGETPALISAGKVDAAVWDLAPAAPELLRRFGNGKTLYSMALSPGGETLATGHEGVIEFWSVPALP